MSGVDIFLSYARQDRATARVIAAGLKEEGFHVWWDAALHPGETFDEVIERNLKEATAVVVLWSPASVASRWVRAEATLADRRNKLVPAIIATCDRPIIFELTHAADLTGWTGDVSDPRWQLFMEDLNRLVRTEAEKAADHIHDRPADTVEAPARPRQALRPESQEVVQFDRKSSADRNSAATPTVHGLHPDPEVHCLQVEGHDLPAEVIIIDRSAVRIGRSAPADVVLPHKSISREHCIVGLANDELFVSDLNSTNGTYIDDERVERPTILPVGSTIRVGQVTLRHSVHKRAEVERSHEESACEGSPTGRLAATS